jgi:hypothetical protein
MTTSLVVNVPSDLYQEIEAYTHAEGQTLNEFAIWGLSEKVATLRQTRGVKGLWQIKPPEEKKEKSVPKKGNHPKKLLRAGEVAEETPDQ